MPKRIPSPPKNKRRCELIRKRSRYGLTPEEEKELEHLEKLCDKWAAKYFPIDTTLDEKIKELEERLRGKEP